MYHKQLELDLDVGSDATKQSSCQVVELSVFAQARQARVVRRTEVEKAQLVAAIVRSVEHITGRSSEAEAM